MANQGKYTLSGGWIYVRGTEDQEDAPCIEAAQSAAVLEWARNEAEEACEPSGDPVRYYGEEDFEDTVSDLVKEITDGHMDEIEHLLDVEFDDLRTPPHHRIGMAAMVEVALPGHGAATEKVPCLIVGRTSAMDRPYRLDVRLADGRTLGECAPECVTPHTAQF